MCLQLLFSRVPWAVLGVHRTLTQGMQQNSARAQLTANYWDCTLVLPEWQVHAPGSCLNPTPFLIQPHPQKKTLEPCPSVPRCILGWCTGVGLWCCRSADAVRARRNNTLEVAFEGVRAGGCWGGATCSPPPPPSSPFPDGQFPSFRCGSWFVDWCHAPQPPRPPAVRRCPDEAVAVHRRPQPPPPPPQHPNDP